MLEVEISMNGITLGKATAEHVADRNGFRDYKCTLTYQGTDGYWYDAEWDMWGHLRDDGAVTLAERLLKEGRHKAKRQVNEHSA